MPRSADARRGRSVAAERAAAVESARRRRPTTWAEGSTAAGQSRRERQTLASLPVFVDIKEVADLPAGSNLVRCETADRIGTPGDCVCLLTAAELADGYGYDGTVPFKVDGEDVFPPRRGTYFEVPKSGKAIRAWAHSTGATQQLRRQLRLYIDE